MSAVTEYPLVKKVTEYTKETYYEYRGYEIFQNKDRSTGTWGRWHVNQNRLHRDSTRSGCVEFIDRYIPERAAKIAKEKARAERFQGIVDGVFEGAEVVPQVRFSRARYEDRHSVDICKTHVVSIVIEWRTKATFEVQLSRSNLNAEQVAELTLYLGKATQIVEALNGSESA